MTKLLLATRNAHKTREFAQLLGADFSVRDLTTQLSVPKIAEPGKTFEENAPIKALAVSRLFPEEIVVADDSGLEVDAIGGVPGVHSARYAGARATDEQNIKKLLRELAVLSGAANGGASSREPGVAGAPPSNLRDGELIYFSRAQFRCVIALGKAGELLATFSGAVGGNIVAPPRGTNGFGYDPIFVPQGFSQTFAELPAELKNRISHRARAARKLGAFLKTLRL
jgi:XTP/dITP diphosphohydrolase